MCLSTEMCESRGFIRNSNSTILTIMYDSDENYQFGSSELEEQNYYDSERAEHDAYCPFDSNLWDDSDAQREIKRLARARKYWKLQRKLKKFSGLSHSEFRSARVIAILDDICRLQYNHRNGGHLTSN